MKVKNEEMAASSERQIILQIMGRMKYEVEYGHPISAKFKWNQNRSSKISYATALTRIKKVKEERSKCF